MNTITHSKLAQRVGVAFVVLSMLFAPITPASANFLGLGQGDWSSWQGQHSEYANYTTYVCHAKQGGGYTKETVGLFEIFLILIGLGHGSHTNDIIPDFIEQIAIWGGQNWDQDGQAIWNNDCNVPTSEPETGTIVVNKVFGQNTPPVAEETFSFKVNNGSAVAFEADGSNQLDEQPLGQYSIVEVVSEGYTASYDNCEFDLAANETETCTITNTLDVVPQDDVATVVVHKLVCTEESDLPNWGAEGNGNPGFIDEDTASDWIATHDSCAFASGWEFEWAPASETNPGDTLVGPAGGNWTTFGPTDANGMTTVSLDADDIGNDAFVWIREVLKPNYIPFTGLTNENDVSAELYCGIDVLNYDNFDRVDEIELDEVFHCVAWNVPEKGSITIEKDVIGAVGEWAFTFESDLTDEGEFTLTNTNPSITFENLTVGEYSIDELLPEGWELAGVSCTDNNSGPAGENDLVVTLDAGEDVTCTFTNEQEDRQVPFCSVDENLLLNGDFETPLVGHAAGWNIFTAVPNWVATWIDGTIAVTPSLELHGGVNGWLPFSGAQYAELDGDQGGPDSAETGETASTRIEQTVTTVPGATYELSYQFSPRPDTDEDDNELVAYVNGTDVDTATADGSSNSNTEWEFRSVTFVADSASTVIAFADGGVSNSLGTFLDDARLCLVELPEPEVNQCTVTIVSDETNTVATEGDPFAVLVGEPFHADWTAVIADASWIWSEHPVADAVGTTTQTFEKTFTWNGPVTDVTLDIATDNSYEVYFNGNLIGSDATENNFGSVDSYDSFALDIEEGDNILSITVTNWAQEGGTQATNPAGLLYKMTVTGTDPECDVIPENGGNNGGGDDNNGGGGGGGSSSSAQSSGGGLFNNPDPEIAGAQTEVLPAGAPNAGMGGAATTATTVPLMLAFISLLGGLIAVRRMTN